MDVKKINLFLYQKRLQQLNQMTAILRSFYDEDLNYLEIDARVMSGNLKELDFSLLGDWDSGTLRLFIHYVVTREWLLKEIEKLRTALGLGAL